MVEVEARQASLAAGESREAPISVMLVENDEFARRAFAFYIDTDSDVELAGVASSRDEATHLAATGVADVAIVDLHVQDAGGIEIVQSLSSETFDLDVVCFSDCESDSLLNCAIEAGASGFLLKTECSEAIGAAVRCVRCGLLVTPRRMMQQTIAQMRLRATSESYDLSDSETDLLRLLGTGMSNAEIAEQLNYSESTVKTYISRLLCKVGRQNRTGLAVLAHELGLADDQDAGQLTQVPNEHPLGS